MLEHILDADPADFLPVEKASPAELLTAQFNASLTDGLDLPTAEEAISTAQANAARHAFLEMTSGATEKEQKAALANLEVPEAVRQVVGMLSAYDWAFVEQAKQMRGYTVAKILEETVHPDVRYRLKALELLGKVTEVALFTERHEVKKTGMTDAELDEQLKERLQKYIEVSKPEEKEVVAVQLGEKT